MTPVPGEAVSTIRFSTAQALHLCVAWVDQGELGMTVSPSQLIARRDSEEMAE
jgi:hypothetical protein